jgi:hypothetical protein
MVSLSMRTMNCSLQCYANVRFGWHQIRSAICDDLSAVLVHRKINAFIQLDTRLDDTFMCEYKLNRHKSLRTRPALNWCRMPMIQRCNYAVSSVCYPIDRYLSGAYFLPSGRTVCDMPMSIRLLHYCMKPSRYMWLIDSFQLVLQRLLKNILQSTIALRRSHVIDENTGVAHMFGAKNVIDRWVVCGRHRIGVYLQDTNWSHRCSN